MSCDLDTFELKAGDTRPTLRLQLYREQNGVESLITDDLTGATVTFRFRNRATPATLYGPFTGEVESNTDKIVRMLWSTGDWSAITADTVVEYECEIQFASGAVETWPTAGRYLAKIWADVD